MSNPRHVNFWIAIIFITALALHSIHFIFRTSMWFDELTGALNVRDHSFYQLVTQSLDYNQVAAII